MNFNIVKTDLEITKCFEIIVEVSTYMKTILNKHNWSIPLSKDDFRNSTIGKTLFIGYHKNLSIATFQITNRDISYREKIWGPIIKNSIVLSRLAILPKYQSQGFGSQCIEFVKEYCQSRKIDSILIDILSGNDKLLEFYEKEGFKLVGNRNITTKKGNNYNIDLLRLQINYK